MCPSDRATKARAGIGRRSEWSRENLEHVTGTTGVSAKTGGKVGLQNACCHSGKCSPSSGKSDCALEMGMGD